MKAKIQSAIPSTHRLQSNVKITHISKPSLIHITVMKATNMDKAKKINKLLIEYNIKLKLNNNQNIKIVNVNNELDTGYNKKLPMLPFLEQIEEIIPENVKYPSYK